MSDRAPTGFFDNVVDRTLANLRNVWREIATSTRGVLSSAQRPDLPEGDVAQLRQQMQSCLDGSGGEVGARARAAELGRTFLGLNPVGRARFLRSGHAGKQRQKSRDFGQYFTSVQFCGSSSR